MKIPTDSAGKHRTWTKDRNNDALLYFVQLVNEAVNYRSPDALKAVSLDSYHRLREVERTWQESDGSAFTPDIAGLVEELISFLSRDPVITVNNSELWDAISSRLESSRDRPAGAVQAIRLLADKISDSYLRHCRDYIEEHVEAKIAQDKRQFRFVVENFCSFLINIGYNPTSIFFRLQDIFFERDLIHSPKRELRSFFKHFPHRQRVAHTVGFAVSSDLASILVNRGEFTRVGEGHVFARRRSAFSRRSPPDVYAWKTPALDAVDARARGEAYLTKVRSVAYTAMPYAELSWDPHVVVMEEGGRSVVLREQIDRIRQGRWLPRGRTTELQAKLDFFLDRPWNPEDGNRLLNAVTSYASAFHSESRSSQLVALWACLEGILPTPAGGGSRISSFAGDLRSAHSRLYLVKHLEALDYDLTGVHRTSYAELLARVVSAKQDSVSRLVALMCFATNVHLHSELGMITADNPLGRQRLYELHSAGKSAKGLYRLVREASQKVEWQLRRIYRERNRIVHRANPSENTDTLIQNLNSYILIVFDMLVRVAARSRSTRRLDDLFAEVRIMEDARERRVAKLGCAPLEEANVDIVLGSER